VKRLIERRGRPSGLEQLLLGGYRYGRAKYNKKGCVHYFWRGSAGNLSVVLIRSSRLPLGFRTERTIIGLIKKLEKVK
jgi:hypothetical protein